MGNSETLQKKIDDHLRGSGILANHDTHRLFSMNGHVGMYEIQEGDSDPDDNSITVNFIIEADITTPLPLKVRF